jgi:polysaccharide deacetylase 2 family uncharacterized protein YibQ
MVFASYRQATAATRGSGKAGLITAAVVLVGGLAAIVAWLWLTGPVPPERVAVVLPPKAVAPPTPPAVAAPPPREVTEAELSEPSPNGMLPIIATDGTTPWQAFSVKFDPTDTRPRITIIVYDLGASATNTDSAIRSLPGAVTLSFMPYWKQVGQWISLARASGHEVMLDLPMEPPDAIHNDLGPNGLRTALDSAANVGRLQWMMAQANGYVGLMGYQGGRFAAEQADLQPVLQELRKRGLLYVDNRASAQSVAPAIAEQIGLPFGVANRQLDTDPSRTGIERKLAELEEVARRDGKAIGIAAVAPAVIDRVAAWAQTLEARGLVLAPVTAVVGVVQHLPAAPPKPADAAHPAGEPVARAAPDGAAAPKR